MTARLVLGMALAVLLVPVLADGVPREPRERVAHHLREVDDLTRHFDAVLRNGCPRFASVGEWDRYFEGEVERVVELLAHLEQAWIEAKRTGDDDVRRAAKAPRQQTHQARALVDRLRDCADDHGARFSPLTLWRRIERDVPRRQAEIALPH